MIANDALALAYADLLGGQYDCVDRIILNGALPLACSPGGGSHVVARFGRERRDAYVIASRTAPRPKAKTQSTTTTTTFGRKCAACSKP